MAAKFSKEVTDRLRACLFVLAAFVTQGPRVAGLLDAFFGADLDEGEESPHFLSFINSFSKKLKAALKQLVATDRAIYFETAQEAALRQLRDEKTSALTRRINALRRTVQGQYANPDLNRLGVEIRTVRDPVSLTRHGEMLVAVSQSDDLDQVVGEPMFKVPVDVQAQGAELQEEIDGLNEIVEQINQKKRGIQELVARKHKDMDAYDQLFVRGTRPFEDFCRLVDENELADRVRPSVSRPGRTEEEPELPDDVPETVSDLEEELTHDADELTTEAAVSA